MRALPFSKALRLLAPLLLLAGAPGGALAKLEATPEGVRFTYKNPGAQAVYLAGSFNGWSGSALPMTRSGDTFTATAKLGPGEHEYKFVVDGQWFADPENAATSGAYGNSVLRVGARGELLEMQATSNTPLSPKILVGGRTIGLFIGRRDETNQDRFSVGRPDFNIDLDFGVRVSEAMDARVLTKIRSAAESTPLWETGLRFDRGHLDLHRGDFALRLFDNEGAGTWNDPLHLVGDLGQYRRQFGYAQQGLRGQGAWRGFRSTLLYTDNFASADPQAPPLDTLAVTAPGQRYDVSLNAGNENVLAMRLEREVASGWTLGAGLRLDRGYNPGSLSQVRVQDDSTRARDSFGRTFERWLGGGIDVRAGAGRWQAHAQWLYGEASVRSGAGVRQTFRSRGSGFALAGEEPLRDTGFAVDASQRWTLGGSLEARAGLRLHAELERERHGLAALATDSLRALRNAATTWRGGARLGDRGRPLRLGADVEYTDFDYGGGAPWEAQLWFADRNFWLDHGEHRLPVARYVQLGGEDATTWSPWLEWTLWGEPEVVFRYQGSIRGTRPGRRPKLVESLFQASYAVTPRLRLYSDTRWVRYDDPVLAVHGGFVATFAEVVYTFAPDISVALSYGVDPFVLDVVTNEYDAIGRNEFLNARGATPAVARSRYLNLGSVLPRAEQALEDERRVQVEAIVRF